MTTTSNAPTPAPAKQRPRWVQNAVDTLREASRWRELRQTPYGLTPVIFIGGLTFFGGLAGGVLGLAAPVIRRDLELDFSAIIFLQTIVGFLLIFVNIGVAYYADRHRRVPLVVGGYIFSGVVTSFLGLAQRGKLWTLGAPTLIGGVGDTVAVVPSSSLLADWYPPESRGRVFAIIGIAGSVVQLISLTIGAYIANRIGWRAFLFIVSPGLSVVGIWGAFRLKEPIRGYMERRQFGQNEEDSRIADEPVSLGEGWRIVWSIRTLRRVFIATSFSVIGETIFGLVFIFYLFDKYHLNIQTGGLAFLPSVLSAILGGFIGGGLVDTLTRRNPGRVLLVFGVFNAVTAVAIVAIVASPSLGFLIGAFCVFSFGGALLGPALAYLFVQITPANIRTLGGAMQGLAGVPAFLFGLPLLNLILNKYTFSYGLLLTVPFYFLSAIVFATAGQFYDFDMRNTTATALASAVWRRATERGEGKMLVCRDVCVEYDGVQVLFDVDFDMEQNEIVALLGTNGAGKSTLLRAISGTQEASGGAVVFNGRDITHMPPYEVAGRGVIHMPGGKGVFPEMTVRENLVLGNWLTDDADEMRTAMREILEIFPLLRERMDEPAAALSGGEQQMLALAQAFLQKPKLLMIDELSLGLSPAVVGQLLDVVREIHKRGVAIIVVEQSVNVALNIAERAVFMEKGEVRFVGKTKDLLSRPDILRAVYVKGTGSLTEGAPAAARRSEREERANRLVAARPILEVADVSKSFGGVNALTDVSFSVPEGQTLGIIGPNGSGKTTLFDIISGYQKADAGTITFDGQDITGLSAEARANLQLVRRFQDARLFPSLTVFETVLVALEKRLEVKNSLLATLQFPNARRSERVARARAERLIELLELGAFRDKFVSELSTGLRRITDLACVLATEPKLLLLDEPSSGIAQAESESLGPLLMRIRAETGCSMLIIEHDMPLISSVSDELLALELGRFVVRGTPEEVLNDNRVIESYLGGSEEAIRRSGSLV